MDTAHYPRHI